MKTIRYVWNQNDGKYLYQSNLFLREERFDVPKDQFQSIFVNILEVVGSIQLLYHVKLFYANGTVIEGWTGLNDPPIDLTNKIGLFDGRFNQ